MSIIWVMLPCSLLAQFAPAAGTAGTTAIHKDSSIIVAWASNCDVVRGWVNAADTTQLADSSNRVSFGTPESAIGPAAGNVMGVVSLGDSGYATLTFSQPIADGPGPDLAVFENSFSSDFLELAFVEVSSDGQTFHRFPCTSLTQDTLQVAPFGLIDPTHVDGFAGKYASSYGVPFDLADMHGIPGLDVMNVTHVRVVDVVGSIGVQGTFDTQGNKVNDPFPTSFNSGGFDLDGVAVLNQAPVSLTESQLDWTVYPNPSHGEIRFKGVEGMLEVFSVSGRRVLEQYVSGTTVLRLESGHYVLRLIGESGAVVTQRLEVLPW